MADKQDKRSEGQSNSDTADGDTTQDQGLQEDAKSLAATATNEPILVDWDGPEDTKNPKNWPTSRKWAAVVIVSAFSFVSQLASSMLNPALPHIRQDLDVPEGVLTQMMFSIYLLAYGLGPFILSPLSEMLGRTPILQLSNIFFLAFTLACGFAQTGGQMLAFRFLAGLGGSAATSVGGGTIGDTFTAEKRASAVTIYTAGPLIAPAIGPVLGGVIAGQTTWRWIFWVTAIVDAVILGVAFMFQRETWAMVLLERKAKALRKETGNESFVAKGSSPASFWSKLASNLVRPLRFLTTQPIVMVLSLYMGYVYGISYLVSSSFAALWTDRYGQSTQISGIHYLALAIGNIIGAQSARLNDKLYVHLKSKSGGVGRPEFRVPALIPCAILLPVGLLWYGWSAQVRLFWLMPDIGAGMISCCTLVAYCGVQTYVVDTYTKYAASAIAAISILRSLAGFSFPLFAPDLYDTLDYGWGNTTLALIAMCIGIPAPWIFWRYGEALRASSPYSTN